MAAIERGRTGCRYILGGHSLSYLEAWRVFARVTGRMPPLGVAPPAAVRLAGLVGDTVSLFTRRERPVNSAAAAMSMLPHNFSSRRAATELGYAYRAFESTVQDAWSWFLDRGYARAVRARTALAR
jgi:dihydroflavonol-4-reductase